MNPSQTQLLYKNSFRLNNLLWQVVKNSNYATPAALIVECVNRKECRLVRTLVETRDFVSQVNPSATPTDIRPKKKNQTCTKEAPEIEKQRQRSVCQRQR